MSPNQKLAVFSDLTSFQKDHTYDSRQNKGEPWKYIIKAAAPTYRQGPKISI